MEEVAGIPTLERRSAYIAYAPSTAAPFRPDLVLIRRQAFGRHADL